MPLLEIVTEQERGYKHAADSCGSLSRVCRACAPRDPAGPTAADRKRGAPEVRPCLYVRRPHARPPVQFFARRVVSPMEISLVRYENYANTRGCSYAVKRIISAGWSDRISTPLKKFAWHTFSLPSLSSPFLLVRAASPANSVPQLMSL